MPSARAPRLDSKFRPSNLFAIPGGGVAMLATFVSLATPAAAESPQQAFVKAWTGRAVVVKTPLYSVLYNERGKLGSTKSGLREGVLIATPSQGAWLQFDGRQGRETVMVGDPEELVNAINAAYEPDSLDLRTYRKLEPLAVHRFDPGVELVVSAVRVDGDVVKLDFAQLRGGKDIVTSIRAKWPLPLTTSFEERVLVEDLLRRFVEVKQP
jgi:hypothetical protein